MENRDNISKINELAISQNGVFTANQAEAFGIPRYALSYAAKVGHIERIHQGAYRLCSAIEGEFDELSAVWMLTKPSELSYDRLAHYDGIAIYGTTAAAMHEVGDYFLSPYHISVPKRFNSRKKHVKYVVTDIPSDEVTIVRGLPVTTLERTLYDLLLLHEDPSLVADALVDTIEKFGMTSFSIDKLEALVGHSVLKDIYGCAGISISGHLELIRTDSFGHVALKRRELR